MHKQNQTQQRGVATILVTIVILLVATIMVTFANRSIIYDVRSSANEARYKEALTIAEAGLDFASAKFTANFVNSFDGSTTTTCDATLAIIEGNSQVTVNTRIDGTEVTTIPGEAYFQATITRAGPSIGCIPAYTVTAIGTGADGTGTATVQRQFIMLNALSGTLPSVPVIVGGAVGTGGNFNIVANPNGGNTPGAPVSVWTNADIFLSNSSATCHLQFYTGGQCPNPSGRVERISSGTGSTLSTYTSTYPDLLPNDPNFPTDLFRFLFGTSRNNWASIKAQAEAVGQASTDCTDVAAAGINAGNDFPIWWISGPCSFSGGVTLGTKEKPIILIIDDNEFKSTGNTQINGISYIFDNPASVATPSADLGGTVEIVGSFISDVGGPAMQGSYSVKYDPDLISSFTTNGSSYKFSVIPHSWRDFQ